MQIDIKEKLMECIADVISEQEEDFQIEREFQFFLARKLQKNMPEANIIIEFNELNFMTDDYIKLLPDKNASYCSFDIGIRLNDKYFPIEIKCSGYENDSSKESFGSPIEDHLNEKGENSLITDIDKIKRVIGKIDKGFCILLTTDQNWIKEEIEKKISKVKQKYEVKYNCTKAKNDQIYCYLIIEVK